MTPRRAAVRVDAAGRAPSPQPRADSTDDQEPRRRVLLRLRRAHGQLAAVIRAVEEGKQCRDVVTQLAATSKALDRAGVILISTAMQDCLSTTEGGGDGESGLTPAELEKLFMMFA